VGELSDGDLAVVLNSSGSEGGEAGEEEVETGEGDEVDGELAEVLVELSGEAE